MTPYKNSSLKLDRKTSRLISGIIVAVLVAIASYFQNQARPVSNAQYQYPENKTYTVTRVFDGDSLELDDEIKVRLIGIDAPEDFPNVKSAKESMATGQDVGTIVKMGREARDFVKGLVEGKKVRLEFDKDKKDKYGRLLAYVFIDTNYKWRMTGRDFREDSDIVYTIYGDVWSLFVNATIIKQGYAEPLDFAPNEKYADLFRKLYQEAKEKKRGLWKQ
ncbi:MAG TPA: thermonuclease family protein [Candidatus Omnitrophota bacterium]|nr:thermonuclease family protein [Candidatus Omnitrophota bacterium]